MAQAEKLAQALEAAGSCAEEGALLLWGWGSSSRACSGLCCPHCTVQAFAESCCRVLLACQHIPSWLCACVHVGMMESRSLTPSRANRRGSYRWSLLPWLLSTKETSPLSYHSEEERPSAPEGNKELIEAQQDSGLGTALPLPGP